jgi:hypothetical protein
MQGYLSARISGSSGETFEKTREALHIRSVATASLMFVAILMGARMQRADPGATALVLAPR